MILFLKNSLYFAPVLTQHTSSGSTTVPQGAQLLSAGVWGAGGGGAYEASIQGGGGGGAGGYSEKVIMITDGDWGQTISFTVGAPGAGKNHLSEGNGTAGGASSINKVLANDSLVMTANGGNGGLLNNGGAGGTASGGDTNTTGGSGAASGSPAAGGLQSGGGNPAGTSDGGSGGYLELGGGGDPPEGDTPHDGLAGADGLVAFYWT